MGLGLQWKGIVLLADSGIQSWLIRRMSYQEIKHLTTQKSRKGGRTSDSHGCKIAKLSAGMPTRLRAHRWQN